MTLKFVNVDTHREYCPMVKALYEQAFPADERAPFWFLLLYASGKNADFYAIYEEEKFVGFVYLYANSKLAYISYLAIHPSCRGQGYGSRVLACVKKICGNRSFVLAVEPLVPDCDNYEQRWSRKRFYRKNGLQDLDFSITEFGVKYDAMGYCRKGGPVTERDFARAMERILGKKIFRIMFRKEKLA